ncbi:MAG: S53 family peptidase [Candidatus Binatus sp.]|uniref:S53 family peptidase n=1 Tax=Candidatus Binatus sp. TaxID=2811406 RepID=UPI00271CD413|nr:S53 family peptidase [Candidatus Binatus sp.]MDO8433005.1 S53 family peptidase [Candidatus Binatus sp.]
MLATAATPPHAIAGEASSVLRGNHPDEAAELAQEGNAPASRQLTMHLMLALNHRGELERLLLEQQNPSSPEYRRWLRPDEFTRRFGPTAAQIEKVSRWLRSSGFTVESASAATRTITFTGKVAQAEQAFGVKIAATADGATFANTTDPAIPADLAPMIDSIQGLDNTLHAAPQMHRRRSDAPVSSAGAPNAIVNGQGPAFGPADQYTFYNQTPLLDSGIDGSGADCIALVEDSNFDTPSLAAFNSQFELPAFNGGNFARTFPTTDPGVNGDAIEAIVDINYAHATAPGTPIKAYIGNQSNSTTALGILDALVKAVKDNSCGAISISFGVCGGSKKFYRALDGVFAQANSQGQSVFVASGDTGSAGLVFNKRTHACDPSAKPSVTEIAASPHVSSIGGTQFSANFDGSGNDVGFVAEGVWNDSAGASGGGKSKVFKKPAFQQGVTPKKDKKRDIPDISIAASPDTPGYFFGESGAVNCCVGGTSVSTPIWAAIAQLIAQSKSAGRVGNINSRLYQLGASGSAAIRDVTAGNNHFGSAAGFNAGPGFDLATGWGTPDIAAFVENF